MSPNEQQDPEYAITVQRVKDLRVHIDSTIVEAEKLLDELASKGTFSRALSLVKTKLEEAKMWGGKRFEELGRTLPAEYQDKVTATPPLISPVIPEAPQPPVINDVTPPPAL